MTSETVYRMDTFDVPEANRDEFLEAVLHTHEILRTQPGFLHDLLLERESGPGSLSILTLAAWENDSAVAAAGAAVRADRADSGFDPRVLTARLGVTGELGNDYGEVA